MKAPKTITPQKRKLKIPSKSPKLDTNAKLDRKSFDNFFQRMIETPPILEDTLKKKKSKSRSGHNNSHNALEYACLSHDADGNLHRSHVATKLPDGSLKYKGRIVVLAKNLIA